MIVLKNGDLLKSNCDIICHQVNCQGFMGAGIAKQIAIKYPEVFEEYRKLTHNNNKLSYNLMGTTQFVDVGDKYIVNMFSQFNIYPTDRRHTDYEAFKLCCNQIAEKVKKLSIENNKKYKIGFPYKIGCGLAGGDWEIVLMIIKEIFDGEEFEVELWKL